MNSRQPNSLSRLSELISSGAYRASLSITDFELPLSSPVSRLRRSRPSRPSALAEVIDSDLPEDHTTLGKPYSREKRRRKGEDNHCGEGFNHQVQRRNHRKRIKTDEDSSPLDLELINLSAGEHSEQLGCQIAMISEDSCHSDIYISYSLDLCIFDPELDSAETFWLKDQLNQMDARKHSLRQIRKNAKEARRLDETVSFAWPPCELETSTHCQRTTELKKTDVENEHVKKITTSNQTRKRRKMKRTSEKCDDETSAPEERKVAQAKKRRRRSHETERVEDPLLSARKEGSGEKDPIESMNTSKKPVLRWKTRRGGFKERRYVPRGATPQAIPNGKLKKTSSNRTSGRRNKKM